MKRIILFLTVCLGLSVSQTTFADNTETARVANKRQISTSTMSTNSNSANLRSVASDVKRGENAQTKNSRTAVAPKQQRVVNRTLINQDVKSRTTTTTQSPTIKNVVTRNTNLVSRTPVVNRVINSRKATATYSTRSAKNQNRKNKSRATQLDAEKIESIKSADYSKCKTVYYECMDEFCANKDSNLRRCACSSRIHEFDNIKKQLSAAEDKMLDFNQRLLLVGMDKADVAAVNVATAGELAFEKKDTSESEKLLQKITKTLNNSGDSKINNDLSAISLSLDMDSAWDNIDSLAGVSTTSKNGLDLYNAANPVCLEMAREVCSDEEFVIVQDGYKLAIQQDCNTVAKSYNTQYNNAMNKVHESGALLDMSRLNIYQQRNSDDTLTCKKKILDQLSDNAVCGTNLHKCLDTTGEYIDPSNGSAFLSENLYNLSNLITEPTGDEKWAKITQNEPFVNFLKSKKKFLEPAMEQCQDIANTIWTEFLDDALAQIKLAQNAKLEEIKRGCTTLVAECKTNAIDDLTSFDARALSVFSVATDKTANEMCRDIENSCIAIMGGDDTNNDYWGKGITGIAANVTFDTIIDTCTQVGRDCIIQKCNGTSGNFALCANITSDNRMAILKHDACWNEVKNCVASADNLNNMSNLPIVSNRQDYYNSLYSNITYSDVPSFCSGNDVACLITEQIWGNCDKATNTSVALTLDSQPNILTPNTDSTLLSWFATNTNNTSCSTYGCPVGYKMVNNICQRYEETTTNDCVTAQTKKEILNVILDSLTNYCATGVRDVYNNCCTNGAKDNGICVPDNSYHALRLVTTTCNSSDVYYCPSDANNRQIYVYCITPNDTISFNVNNSQYECTDGYWILIDQYGNYFDFQGKSVAPTMGYRTNGTCATQPDANNLSCTYGYNNGWSFGSSCQDISTSVPTDNEFMINW